MTPLEQSFNDILIPSNFIKNFVDDEHFMEWARKVTINDLKHTLSTFLDHEEYHHCALIQSVIDEKVDNMLSGFGFY